MLNYLENIKDGNEKDEKWKVLYRKLEDGRYELAGLYDPNIQDEDYEDDLYAINFSSVFGGTELLLQNQEVWNARGTTHDPNHESSSWLALWRDHVRGDDQKCYVNDGTCNCQQFVGGHMVLSVNDVYPAVGGNQVRIIPICKTHNNSSNQGVMHISEAVTAVKLENYFR